MQDRLREWRGDVLEKIEHFACMALNQLDFDGFRIDKGLQVTVDPQGEWSDYIRQCARKLGKEEQKLLDEFRQEHKEADESGARRP